MRELATAHSLCCQCAESSAQAWDFPHQESCKCELHDERVLKFKACYQLQRAQPRFIAVSDSVNVCGFVNTHTALQSMWIVQRARALRLSNHYKALHHNSRSSVAMAVPTVAFYLVSIRAHCCPVLHWAPYQVNCITRALFNAAQQFGTVMPQSVISNGSINGGLRLIVLTDVVA